jgi:N-acetylglucosaminyl-diphospho-decaprenol L-rhamnosyltransferase
MAASIDVVIPVHGRYELTRDCLEHLSSQTVAHSTIVVDDGSRDDTVARLRSDWPRVEVVALGANQGYTRAVNRGVAAGEGEFVVLLNNDVLLEPRCLERLVAPLLASPQIGSVASLMLAPGKERIDSFGICADVTLAGFARLHGLPRAEAGLPGPVLAGAEGTAGAYRRRAWEQAGGLDEGIVAYMEVLDLALRLRAAGWEASSAPDARGVHLGSASYRRGSPDQRRLAGRSRGYLLRRYEVLRGRQCARTLLTEAIVVAADLALSRDLAALRGRIQGWSAASGMPPRPQPPAAALDGSISLRRSLQLRRRAYGL